MKKNILFLVSLLLSIEVFAAGLSSPTTHIVLSNLKIGQQYSLRQLLGYPFTVHYKGTAQADMKIDLIKPSTTSPDGYEPIPDISWISLTKDTFSLDPGEAAETDVIINIPNDEKYLGKNYNVVIIPAIGAPKDATGSLVTGVAIVANMRLSIAAKPPTEQELRQLRKQRLGGNINVMFTPERIFLYDVPLGKKTDIKKELNEVLKVVNSTDFKINILTESISPSAAGITPPEGYTQAPNIDFLIVGKKNFTVQPNAIKEIPLYIKLPNKEEYRGKKFYFILRSIAKSTIMEAQYHTKIYVETAK